MSTVAKSIAEIPREYQPYEHLFGYVSAPVTTSAPLNDPVKFDTIKGDQKLITVTQGTNITTFTLKKGHKYKCWADVIYYDSDPGAGIFDRDYSWYKTSDNTELGVRGVEGFSNHKFDYSSGAYCVVDASDADIDIAIKVVDLIVSNVNSYIKGSKCMIEVITDRSGPWNQSKK